MKKQLLMLCATLIGLFSFAQNALVHYKVDGNLFPEAGYDTSLSPVLTKSSGTGYNNSNTMLETNDSNEYAELSINTIGKSNLVLSFYISIGETWGSWTIYTDNGSGGAVDNEIGGPYIIGGGVFIQGARTINFPIPASALNKTNVKFRIKSSFPSIFGAQIGSDLRLDNIKILGGNPNIRVYSSSDTFIPDLSPASVALNTDFLTSQTTGSAVTKNFRVRNFNGAILSKLNVDTIKVSGANAGDFTVSPIQLLGIDATASGTGTYKQFSVSFLPLADGIRTAEIILISNAAPSPYTFTVVGVGASCELKISNYAINQMVPWTGTETQTLPAKYVSTGLPVGSGDLIGGNSCAPSPNIGQLFPSNNLPFIGCVNDKNLYNSPSQSLIVRNTTKEIEFGGSLGLDISKQKKISIQFNIAAFGKSSNRGVNSNAYITLSVLKPDGLTWSEEMKLLGSDTTGNYFNYAFGNGDVFTGSYDGNNLATQANNVDGGWFGTSYTFRAMKLDFPSVNLQRLKFRIKAYTPDDQGMWLIDDVRVVTSNSEYRTYRTDGKWVDSDNVVVTDPVEATKSFENYKAIIKGNYTVPAQGLTICECEVDNVAGAKLNIPQNTVLTVRGNIINNAGVGNFIATDGSNLMQIENDAVNTGDITAQKLFTFTVPVPPTPNRQQYNYVISPVVGQNLKTIYLGNPATLFHVESTNNFGTSSGAYIPGRALAVKEPATSFVAANSVTAEFKGVPFNGELAYPLAYTTTNPTVNHGYNLVGNPYPSNLDLQKLYNYNRGGFNNKNVIDPTFQFWDNRGNTQLTQQGSSYNGANYAKFNVINGTGVPAGGTAAPGAIHPVRTPNQFVKVGTGFMVRAKSTANGQPLYFNNSMRSSDNTGPGFFGKEGSRDRFWLSFTTPTEMQFMNAVVYFPNGDNGYGLDDSDASSSSERIYSIVDEHEIAIQGRAPFTVDDKVDLGFSAFVSGTHTISIYDKEGVFAQGQNIYLKDKQTGVITNLSQNSYTFTTDAGENTGRFEIIYKPETILVTDSVSKDQIVVYRDQDNFVIQSPKTIASVEVYEMSGKLFKVLKPNNKQAVLEGATLARGIYILHIKATDGEVTNKKIIR